MGLRVPTNHIYKKFSIPKPEDSEEVATPTSPTPMMLKDDVSMIANKGTDSDLNQLNKKYQSDIDALADEATKQSLSIFDKIFEPVRQLLADAKSLEGIKEQFESDDFVEKLYEELDASELEELLQKSMFYADMLGRMKENERSI